MIDTSGRAVEAASDVDVLLLGKTGTITLGNRRASEFIPAQGVDEKTLADAALLASLADETPEGREYCDPRKQRFHLRERDVQSLHATFVPFTAQSRMSGISIDNRMICKVLSMPFVAMLRLTVVTAPMLIKSRSELASEPRRWWWWKVLVCWALLR